MCQTKHCYLKDTFYQISDVNVMFINSLGHDNTSLVSIHQLQKLQDAGLTKLGACNECTASLLDNI